MLPSIVTVAQLYSICQISALILNSIRVSIVHIKYLKYLLRGHLYYFSIDPLLSWEKKRKTLIIYTSFNPQKL